MKVELPQLDLTPENIVENRKRIAATRKLAKALLKALDGLDNANEGLCEHPRDKVQKRYDPGYGGGGYSHSECLVCGSTNAPYYS